METGALLAFVPYPETFHSVFIFMFQSSSVLLFFLLEEPIDPSGVLKGALIV